MKKRGEMGDCPKCESESGWDIKYNSFNDWGTTPCVLEWLKYSCYNCGYSEEVYTADYVEGG